MPDQHHPHRRICTIVPPHILEQIARHGSPGEQSAALRTLQVDASLRTERGLAPTQPSVSVSRGLRQRAVHDAEHSRTLPGALVRGEGRPATGDVDADAVYDGFGATWDLFHDVFGRDSYDDAGAELVGTVNYGRGYNNAFWNGTQMVFGDGDGRIFVSFTSAIDIMSHELTHAVTEYESGLEYHDQPGALNEHLSDVFGSLVKQRVAGQTATEADWLIGAGILGPTIHGVALRSMMEPGSAYDDPVLGKDPQPGHMSDFIDTEDDQGGVHLNSGIPNRAFYLFAAALGGYAWEQAGGVWYATATDDALPATAQFADFAALTVLHADTAGAQVGDACRRAWAEVGLPQSPADVATWEDGELGAAPEPLPYD